MDKVIFSADVYPVWAFLVAGIVFMSFLVPLLKTEGIDNALSSFFYSLSLAAIPLVIVMGITALSPLGDEDFSNPGQKPPLSMDASVNKEEMNAKIAETIDADKVSVNVDDGGSKAVKSLAQGDIFDFTAINDSSKINGSFYFTDDTMQIIVEDEQQVKQEYSINTNE